MKKQLMASTLQQYRRDIRSLNKRILAIDRITTPTAAILKDRTRLVAQREYREEVLAHGETPDVVAPVVPAVTIAPAQEQSPHAAFVAFDDTAFRPIVGTVLHLVHRHTLLTGLVHAESLDMEKCRAILLEAARRGLVRVRYDDQE